MNSLETEIMNHGLRAIATQEQGSAEEAKTEWFLYDNLKLLKSILDSGSCNECKHKKICLVCPSAGDLVRYNCAFFMREGESE